VIKQSTVRMHGRFIRQSLTIVSGRSFVIVPYAEAKEGFIDIDEDDFKDEEQFLSRFQRNVIKLRGDQWS
jgi:hypothetical protein